MNPSRLFNPSAPPAAAILAIDLGTSGPKVALMDLAGRLLGMESEPTPVIFLPGGGVEQDPALWWRAIVAATRRLLSRGLIPVERILALGVTAQWSGTVAVDRAGQPLMNAIIWMDDRGAAYAQAMTDGPIKIEGYGAHKMWTWVRMTGGIPGRSGKDPVAHIRLVQDRFPEVYARTHKFLEPKDFLNLKLTGQFAAGTDSIVLHWVTDNRDIHNIHYSDRLLGMAGLEREKLPDLFPATHILGPILPDVAAELGLRAHVQVGMGTPDVQSAALGSGAVADGAGHVYVGTSGWLSCFVPYKKTDLFHNMASLPSPLPGRYYLINEQEMAGGCLAWLKDSLFFADDALATGSPGPDVYPRFDRLAETAPPGSHGLIFTPWLNGERSPVEDHHLRGGFHNLSISHNRGDWVRAVYEGVALNARWLLGAVERFVGGPFPSLNLIGGGAKGEIWCQIYADILDRPMHRVAAPILANARGVALLTAVGMGELGVEQIGEVVEIDRIFEPTPAHRRLYDERFRVFQEIYKRNRRINARLNR